MTNLNTSEALKEQLHIDPLMFLVSGIGKEEKNFYILCGAISYLDKKPQYYSVENGGFTRGKTKCRVRATEKGDSISVGLQEALQALDENKLPIKRVTKDGVFTMQPGDLVDGIMLLVRSLPLYQHVCGEEPKPTIQCGFVFDEESIGFAEVAYSEFCTSEKAKCETNTRLTKDLFSLVASIFYPDPARELGWEMKELEGAKLNEYKDKLSHLLNNSILKGLSLTHENEEPVDVVVSCRTTTRWQVVMYLYIYQRSTTGNSQLPVFEGGFRWKVSEDQASHLDLHHFAKYQHYDYMEVLMRIRDKAYDLFSTSYDTYFTRIPESGFTHQMFSCTYTTDLTVDNPKGEFTLSPSLCLHYSNRDKVYIGITRDRVDDDQLKIWANIVLLDKRRQTSHQVFEDQDEVVTKLPESRWNSVDRGNILRTVVKVVEAKYRQLRAERELLVRRDDLNKMIQSMSHMNLTCVPLYPY